MVPAFALANCKNSWHYDKKRLDKHPHFAL